MPSTVADVIVAAGLIPAGVVPWATAVPEVRPGVYVVALTDDPVSTADASPAPPFDNAALAGLLAVRPELQVDNQRPTATQLRERLAAFWLPDEVVVYVGLAGTSVTQPRESVLQNSARGAQAARRRLVAENPHGP